MSSRWASDSRRGARAAIGTGVVYRPHPQAVLEDGEITAVGQVNVFVRFVGDRAPELLSPP